MSYNKEVFAANLRAARAFLNISQEELSKASGVSLNAIKHYESGSGYTPGADKVYALCVALGKSPNELMGWGEV